MPTSAQSPREGERGNHEVQRVVLREIKITEARLQDVPPYIGELGKG
jgi:hypothetical protein